MRSDYNQSFRSALGLGQWRWVAFVQGPLFLFNCSMQLECLFIGRLMLLPVAGVCELAEINFAVLLLLRAHLYLSAL